MEMKRYGLYDILAAFFCVAIVVNGCKTPPPDRLYASDEVAPITEQPRDYFTYYYTNAFGDLFLATGYFKPSPQPVREPRPAPVAPPPRYVFYTNSQQDALVERDSVTSFRGPPAVPGFGPFPLLVVPRTLTSNWMTKASAVQPKPMTNQIPGSVILTRITTTDKDGKKFSAELTLVGDQTVYANDKMSLVMFAIYQTNFVVEFCTNLTDGIWHTMSSGVGQNTNSALAIFDLHEGTKPVNFYRRKPAP